MNNKQRVDVLLSELADAVYDEIPEHDEINRSVLSRKLGLTLPSYPQHSETQGPRTWIIAALLRRLEDAGRVEAIVHSRNNVCYRRTGK